MVMGSRAAVVVISDLMRSYTICRIMRWLAAPVHSMPVLPASRRDDVCARAGNGRVEGSCMVASLRHVDLVDYGWQLEREGGLEHEWGE